MITRAVVVWAAVTLGAAGADIAPLAAQGSAPRIGFVRSQEILRQTPGYAKAESTFTAELEKSQKEIEKLQSKLDSAIKAFEQQSIALTPTARQNRQRELGELQRQFQQRAGELQEKARERERELLEPIQQRVNQVIQGIRAEGNYSLIFDADASPGIIAADPALNLTAKVLERLRQ